MSRLINLGIAESSYTSPLDVVSHLGALQAQDYRGAKWSIGLRLPGSVDADIERAIADKTIVRTWPMRGTLHFVAPQDVYWMLKLLSPRPIAAAAKRREMLGLKDEDFARCAEAFINELKGGKQALRSRMYEIMDSIGVPSSGQRGMHVIRHLAMDGLLCFGSHEDKQPSFALLHEWCPRTFVRDRDESLRALACSYFTSHGPATLNDFVGWSGLTAADAKNGLQLSSDHLKSSKDEGQTYWMAQQDSASEMRSMQAFLLPGFDEYMLGYKDRSAALSAENAAAICPGNNGMFIPTIVINGAVTGTWSKAERRAHTIIEISPFRTLRSDEIRSVEGHAQRYGEFIERPVKLEVSPV